MTIQPSAIFAGRLTIGVTGRRDSALKQPHIADVLEAVFETIDERRQKGGPAQEAIRLHTLLAPGVDQVAAAKAAARGWQIVAPLPFGQRLNVALNALPQTPEDARALIAGREPANPDVAARAEATRYWIGQARLRDGGARRRDRDAAVRDARGAGRRRTHSAL